MINRSKQMRKYSAPSSKETSMALESNFCATVRFHADIEVDELDNINTRKAADGTTEEPMYFEF